MKMNNNTLSSSPLSDGQTPSTSKATQKSSHTPVSIFLGITVLIVVGLGGVLLGKYLFAPKTPPVAPAVTPTPQAKEPIATPTLSPDLTSNWKTYANEDFSFQYPSDWTVERDQGIGPDNQPIDITNPIRLTSSLTQVDIGYTGVPGFGSEISCSTSVHEETIVVAELRSTKTFYECDTTEAKKFDAAISVVGFKEGSALEIYYQYNTINRLTSEKLLDQILSTFKFIE